MLKSAARVTGIADKADLAEWEATTLLFQGRPQRELVAGKSLASVCKEINDARPSQQLTVKEMAQNAALREGVRALATEQGQRAMLDITETAVDGAAQALEEGGKKGMKQLEKAGSAIMDAGASMVQFAKAQTKSLTTVAKSSAQRTFLSENLNEGGHHFRNVPLNKQMLIPLLNSGLHRRRQQTAGIGLPALTKSERLTMPTTNDHYGLYKGQFFLPSASYYRLKAEERRGAKSEGGRRQTRRRKGRKSKKTRKHA